MTEKNLETGARQHQVDLWPLFTWHRDLNGNRWLQILAPIEPVLPNNRGVERNWSPLWSVWRSESNPQSGATSQSLLWNFYRYDTAPAAKNCSLIFGLFQYQSNREGKCVRLFYVPVVKTRSTVNHEAGTCKSGNPAAIRGWLFFLLHSTFCLVNRYV